MFTWAVQNLFVAQASKLIVRIKTIFVFCKKMQSLVDIYLLKVI